MLDCIIVNVESKDKSEENITWFELRKRALDEANLKLPEGCNVVNVIEDSGTHLIQPRLSNSSTWYREKWFNLVVYYTK